jgi:hypothetical protein
VGVLAACGLAAEGLAVEGLAAEGLAAGDLAAGVLAGLLVPVGVLLAVGAPVLLSDGLILWPLGPALILWLWNSWDDLLS